MSTYSAGSPFATVEFVRAWQEWKGFAVEPVESPVLAGNLELFLVPRRFGPFSILSFPWVGYAGYLDFPYSGDPTDQIVTLLHGLTKNPSWDLLVLPNLLSDSQTLAVIKAIAPKYGIRFKILERDVAPYLALTGSWQQLYERRSSSYRKKLRWSERRLAQIGKVEFIHYCAEKEVDESLSWAFKIHEDRWTKQYSSSRFRSREREFFRVLARRMARRDWFDLAFVRVGGRPIAFCYALIYGGCYYYYVAAMDRDPQYSAYSPGAILLKHLIERCFENGLERFDFMLGNEPYKQRWAEEARSVVTLCAANPTIGRSQLALGAYVGAYRLTRKLRSSPVIRRLADLSTRVGARWS